MLNDVIAKDESIPSIPIFNFEEAEAIPERAIWPWLASQVSYICQISIPNGWTTPNRKKHYIICLDRLLMLSSKLSKPLVNLYYP